MRGGKTVAEAGPRRAKKTPKKFSDAWVEKLKPPAKPPAGPGQENFYWRLDKGDRSLVMSVSYGSSRTWRLYMRDANGKGLTVKLGVWNPAARDHMPVAAALKAAVDYELPATKAVTDATNFKVIAEQWLHKKIDGKKRTEAVIRRYFERLVFPVWKDRSIMDLKRSDVRQLLAGIETEAAKRSTATAGGRVMADKVHAVLSSLFKWYSGQDDDFLPPIVAALRRDERDADEKKRDRTLDPHGAVDGWKEIPALWKATAGPVPYFGMIRMLLLTGQRLSKVQAMRHADISEDGVWRVPMAPREKSNIGVVRLPRLALDVIREMPRVANNDYVFPATGRGPVDASSYAKAQLDQRMASELGEAFRPWRIHDLRRSARTALSHLGVPREHAERVLGHSLGSSVERTYDRHDFFEVKSDALAKLSAFIERIVSPPDGSNVIPLRPTQGFASDTKFDGDAETIEVAHG